MGYVPLPRIAPPRNAISSHLSGFCHHLSPASFQQVLCDALFPRLTVLHRTHRVQLQPWGASGKKNREAYKTVESTSMRRRTQTPNRPQIYQGMGAARSAP